MSLCSSFAVSFVIAIMLFNYTPWYLWMVLLLQLELSLNCIELIGGFFCVLGMFGASLLSFVTWNGGAWAFIFGPLAENCFIWLLWPGLLHGINVIKTKSSWMGVYRMIFAIQNVIFKPLVTWARSFCLSELFMFPFLRAKLFSFAATIDLIKQYYQHFLG